GVDRGAGLGLAGGRGVDRRADRTKRTDGRGAADHDIVLDARVQVRTEGEQAELADRLIRDAAVEAPLRDLAEVTIHVALDVRIVRRGQAVGVVGVPAGHLRLERSRVVADAQVEVVGRLRLRVRLR